MPPGTTLSGVLVFDVPRDATVGHLSYGDDGGPTELRLPPRRRPRPAPSHSGVASLAARSAGHPTGHPTP